MEIQTLRKIKCQYSVISIFFPGSQEDMPHNDLAEVFGPYDLNYTSKSGLRTATVTRLGNGSLPHDEVWLDYDLEITIRLEGNQLVLSAGLQRSQRSF